MFDSGLIAVRFSASSSVAWRSRLETSFYY